MPNNYITPTEIKSAAPEIIKPETTRYNQALMRLCDHVSRTCDKYCNRRFYPISATKYYNGNGEITLRIDDVIAITTLEYSDDDGASYTELTEAGNWIPTREDNYNHPGSYDMIEVDANSTILSAWPEGQRSIKITGTFVYADDRDLAWEDSQDEVEDDPLLIGATTLTVNDVDGSGLYAAAPRLHAGLLIRIEDEYCEITATDTEQEKATIIRGINGSAAAEHVQNKSIDIWRPPEPVKQAAAIMAVRAFERGLQGYGDTRAQPEVGQLFFLRKIDPEAQEYLNLYRIPTSK